MVDEVDRQCAANAHIAALAAMGGGEVTMRSFAEDRAAFDEALNTEPAAPLSSRDRILRQALGLG